MKFWEWQYELAKQGKEHTLPEDCLRMPANEMHQLMSKEKEFWNEFPKDFSTILDVGCSDGYMVQVFNAAGKEATCINDKLYPTGRLFIDEHDLSAFQMDMHNMESLRMNFSRLSGVATS